MSSVSTDEIIAEVKRCEGNLRKAASLLGLQREGLAYRVKKEGLWPIVNEARANRVKGTSRNPLITRARRVLKG